MRDFQKLDPNALKAFYYAAESLNFTRAAELAALTQSGISQHVARLEDELGVNLFQRSGRKVRLTAAGLKLKSFTEEYLDQIDKIYESIRDESENLQGLVRYAMPDSCLMTPHFSILLEQRKNFPDVRLRVTLCESEKVTELLLNGDIDFGFVTHRSAHKDIEAREFVREEHVLVGNNESLLKNLSLKELKGTSFVSFPGMEVLFDNWRGSFFPKSPLALANMNICGEMNSLGGAITMAVNGVGLGVFPRHCVEPQLKKKELFAFQPDKKVENPIYIIQLNSKYPTARVKRVLDVFWKMKKP
jgi:DNA-binding transcriptional LysR family regulator